MRKVKCRSRQFDGIVDPYTGKTLEVTMLIGMAEPLFACSESYSVDTRHPTKAAAVAAWAMEGGVGNVRLGRPFRCAYTGADLSLKHDEYGYWFSGGLDLRKFRPRTEFLYYARMRDGRSDYPAPPDFPKVESVPPRPDGTPVHHEIGLADEADRLATAIVAKSGVVSAPTRVSMSVPGKRRRGR